jgi:hypothetical protein
MFILFHMDSPLCSVFPTSRTPTPGANPALHDVVGYGPQAAHISKAPTLDRAATASIAAPEALEMVTGDGSPALVPDSTATIPISLSTDVCHPHGPRWAQFLLDGRWQ